MKAQTVSIERQTDRQTDRQRQRDRDRETETERQRQGDRETDRQRQTDRQTDRECLDERERQTQRERVEGVEKIWGTKYFIVEDFIIAPSCCVLANKYSIQLPEMKTNETSAATGHPDTQQTC